ncbi:hypothetical protein N9H83_02065 [Gammaproteobacteria bacterium]|nr:hypothetical protein [Gammaproteobacteria bacterium]
MKKKWLVALFKINEIERVERNLSNQKFDFYLPKITIKKINSSPIEEPLFPGYIFVNTGLQNYSALRYTKGIKNILKFGNNISCISNEDVRGIQIAEETSKIEPVSQQLRIGKDVFIKEGSLKGAMVKICSLHSKDRVTVLLNLLGSMRRVVVPIKDINL